MARQYLQDDGFLEPAITDPLAANTSTSAVGLYNSLQYALIPAYDSGRASATSSRLRDDDHGRFGHVDHQPVDPTTNAAGTTLGASITPDHGGLVSVRPWF